jgi:nucleoside-diphosphate-sugar epimerase
MASNDGTRRALITGAHGIVGLNVVEELALDPSWRIAAIGRRPNPPMPGIGYFSADLTDAASTAQALSGLGDTTHLFFGAFQFAPDPHAEGALNLAMLRNTLDGLKAAGARLERVVIYEGAKAYGALLGPMRTPAKERDPRVPGPLYYFDLEDELFARGKAEGFSSKFLRPDFILGIGFGAYTNLLHTLAMYATICKMTGLPLYFPGGENGYNTLFQMTDARLLARASVWAALLPDREDDVFNVTNGDLFRWGNAWPRIADYFGLPAERPLVLDMAVFMADKAPMWNAMAEKHGLAVRFEQLMDWRFGGILGLRNEVHSSTVKIRQAGFHECLDTEDRLIALLDEMKTRRLIPSL